MPCSLWTPLTALLPCFFAGLQPLTLLSLTPWAALLPCFCAHHPTNCSAQLETHAPRFFRGPIGNHLHTARRLLLTSSSPCAALCARNRLRKRAHRPNLSFKPTWTTHLCFAYSLFVWPRRLNSNVGPPRQRGTTSGVLHTGNALALSGSSLTIHLVLTQIACSPPRKCRSLFATHFPLRATRSPLAAQPTCSQYARRPCAP